MSYQLKLEKIIARPASDVFRALQEGRLFMNCGFASDTMKIDFRVGGKYHIDLRHMAKSNFGEFLDIVPNKKIVFSWCQVFDENQKPDTKVTIELFEQGNQTRLVLEHTGFHNKDVCDGHTQGWTSGLDDLSAEIQEGRLRMVRSFSLPVEKVFEACKNPSSFFAFMGDLSKGTVDVRTGGQYQVPTKKGEVKGEFLEIIPNKKISLSWLVGCSGPLKNSQVTLNFNIKNNGSSLELIHSGLLTEEEQKAHRAGWEHVTAQLSKTLQ